MVPRDTPHLKINVGLGLGSNQLGSDSDQRIAILSSFVSGSGVSLLSGAGALSGDVWMLSPKGACGAVSERALRAIEWKGNPNELQWKSRPKLRAAFEDNVTLLQRHQHLNDTGSLWKRL